MLIGLGVVLFVIIVASTVDARILTSQFKFANERYSGLGGKEKQSKLLVLNNNTLQSYHKPSLNELPTGSGGPVAYTVQKGDTISKIADKFDITTQTILHENGLTKNSLIHPGDELTILPTSGITHEVKRGESVSAIAYKYGVEMNEIIKTNDLPKNGFIEIGQKLIIPGVSADDTNQTDSGNYASADTKTSDRDSNSSMVYPASGKNWGDLHAVNAIDIANQCGTPIYAAAPGEIILSDAKGWNGGYGPYIKISHPNGTVTVYAHLRAITKYSGWVQQGEQIAIMGTKGNSTGCHLHFEIRGQTNPFVGPTRYVNALSGP